MKLPTWIPKVSRPFNEDYAQTWDVMDDDAKRWSWLFDAFLLVGVVLMCVGYTYLAVGER